MGRKKRKKTAQQEKQQARHQRNTFFKKLKYTMARIGDASAFDMLDKTHLTIVFMTRIRPHRIIAASNGHPRSKMFLRELNLALSQLMKNKYTEVGANKCKISFYDFAVYVESIYLIWRNIEKDIPEIAAAFKACFPVFNDDFETLRKDVYLEVDKYLHNLVLIFSHLTHSVFRIEKVVYKDTHSITDTSVFKNDYIIDCKVPEAEALQLAGQKRTVYRVWLSLDDKFEAFALSSEKLGLVEATKAHYLPVYIQQHAINRIGERLADLFARFNYVLIVSALLLEDPIPCPGGKGFLFRVVYGAVCVGYLKCDIAGGNLVVRTFLFLTNNGTPEGKRLHQLLGIQKADKKYLGIDKLSTFLNSDIHRNKVLVNLFEAGGCAGLFKLSRKTFNNAKNGEKQRADFILRYLDLK